MLLRSIGRMANTLFVSIVLFVFLPAKAKHILPFFSGHWISTNLFVSQTCPTAHHSLFCKYNLFINHFTEQTYDISRHSVQYALVETNDRNCGFLFNRKIEHNQIKSIGSSLRNLGKLKDL